jgi:hypothetical protein
MSPERLQTRMDAIATLLELRFPTPDAPARSARAFAQRCAVPSDGVTAEELWGEASRVVEHLPSFLGRNVEVMLERPVPPTAALRLARAVWKLLDRNEDAECRAELATIGQRLAAHLSAGRDAEARASVAELAEWRATHHWALFYAIKHAADAGDEHPPMPSDGVRLQG